MRSRPDFSHTGAVNRHNYERRVLLFCLQIGFDMGQCCLMHLEFLCYGSTVIARRRQSVRCGQYAV